MVKDSQKGLSKTKKVKAVEEKNFNEERTFWDRIPTFRWWVTPLNILFICLFLIVIDIVTQPNTSWLGIDWAWWPIGGLWFVYAVSFIFFKRPAIAWIIGPILMIGISGLLFALDYVFPRTDPSPSIDWAYIPAAAILTFGVLIPIISKVGRKRKKPIEKFRKAVSEMEKET
ncbi:MAG: hypothetical protein U9O98_00470 [Asgard group archaeon]|nr:hypothetical protein [Asgard group archaeon]